MSLFSKEEYFTSPSHREGLILFINNLGSVYCVIEQSHFLNSLYNKIPKLENVRIEGIYIKEKAEK